MSTETKSELKQTKIIKCVVDSDKMNKSRVGVVERRVRHPIVDKILRRSTRIMFHDENNETHIGDIVEIKPSKPMSSRKAYTLLRVIKKSED